MIEVGPNTMPPATGPWAWQSVEDETHGDDAKHAIFASPRMGKTNAVCMTLRRRALAGLWTRALVVAPLRGCSVWMDALEAAGLPALGMFDRSRKKWEPIVSGPWTGVLVINRDKLAEVAEVLRGDRMLDVFIADESHNFAAVSSDRAIAYRRLARATPYVRALTGTPVPRHYGSLWSQLAPLRDEWETSFEKFAQKFLIRDAMFRSRVIGHINVEELRTRVLRVATIKRREDEFGKDKFIPITRYVELPERARKLYNKLAKEWVIDDPEFKVEAANPAIRLMRLQQLTSGFLPTHDPDNEEGASTAMVHQAKLDMLIADLDEIFENDEKAVIWHRFKPEGIAAYEEIRLRYPNVPVFKLAGGVSKVQWENDQQRFTAIEGPACYVVQIQAGSEAISLAAADHALYLSRTFSLIDDEQSRDRIYEIGKPRVLAYYEVANSVDGFIGDVLESKHDMHQAIRNADRESLAYGPIKKRRKKAA